MDHHVPSDGVAVNGALQSSRKRVSSKLSVELQEEFGLSVNKGCRVPRQSYVSVCGFPTAGKVNGVQPEARIDFAVSKRNISSAP